MVDLSQLFNDRAWFLLKHFKYARSRQCHRCLRRSVKYGHGARTAHARRAAFICAGAEVHAAADGEPGSVVQPQSPEAHNEQKSKSSWWTQSFKYRCASKETLNYKTCILQSRVQSPQQRKPFKSAEFCVRFAGTERVKFLSGTVHSIFTFVHQQCAVGGAHGVLSSTQPFWSFMEGTHSTQWEPNVASDCRMGKELQMSCANVTISTFMTRGSTMQGVHGCDFFFVFWFLMEFVSLKDFLWNGNNTFHSIQLHNRFFFDCDITSQWYVTVERIVHLNIYLLSIFFCLISYFSPPLLLSRLMSSHSFDCCPALIGSTCSFFTQIGFVASRFPPVQDRLCLLDFITMPVCCQFGLHDSWLHDFLLN